MSGYGSSDDHLDNIEAVINNGIDLARSRITSGESNTHCDECGDVIPEGRRLAAKGCKYCINCQVVYDKLPKIRAVDWML